MDRIYAVLNTKAISEEWKPCHKAAFRSTFTNRQWPQAMKAAAGLATHAKCYVEGCKALGGEWPPAEDDPKAAEALPAAPKGTLVHRHWTCGSHS